MSLLDKAREDFRSILEDNHQSGFGIPVILEGPTGARYGEDESIIGQGSDIGILIDPGTGISARGRSAEISLSIYTLNSKGINFKELKSGWKVISNDPQGNSNNFRVKDFDPDQTLGAVKLILEVLNVSNA